MPGLPDQSHLTPAEGLSESLEDYLEAILGIEQQRQTVRPKEIAQRLSVSAPSVTAALRRLAGRGLVNYAPYDPVTLTPRGRRMARDVRRRHDALRRFFVDLLRIDPQEADQVSCRMEHALPADVLARFVEFMDFIDTCPQGAVTWTPQAGYRRRFVEPLLDPEEPASLSRTAVVGAAASRAGEPPSSTASSVADRD